MNLNEFLVLSTFSRSPDSGSSFSITMAAGGPKQVARLLVLAGKASLNNSCVVENGNIYYKSFMYCKWSL